MSNTIQSWNDDLQDVETIEITEDSKIMLGCENEPTVTVSEWMDLRYISTLEAMCDYIADLDFNVQVVG